jgi:hypothetical protein
MTTSCAASARRSPRSPAADAPDIYAISFFIYDEDDDPQKPTITIGYNTESQVKRVLDPAGRDPDPAHPGGSLSGDPAGDPRGQRLLSLPQRRADDPPDPVPGRRLDLLALQVRQQLLTDLVDLPLLLAHVRGQPLCRLVSVPDRALRQPEVPPDIRPVSLDRPAVPLIEPQLIRGNVHQPRDVGDNLVRNLAAACREPAVHRIEPEQKSEPELRRATPPRQLLQLITDQRPVPDQLIIQHTRHETSGSPRKYGGDQPPQTQRIRINTGRARSATSRGSAKILNQPAEGTSDLAPRNRVYLSYRHRIMRDEWLNAR